MLNSNVGKGIEILIGALSFITSIAFIITTYLPLGRRKKCFLDGTIEIACSEITNCWMNRL